jgi:hypothetical protein
MKHRGIKTTCLAVIATVLCSCASKAPKDFDLAKTPNDGIAIFSVSHDAAAGRGVTLMVYLDRDAGPLGLSAPYKSVEDIMGVRTSSDFDPDYGRIQVVNLPAGKHVFSFWQLTNGTGLRVVPNKNLPPLVFEIKPGAIVYLGDFHGVTTEGRNLLGIPITAGGYPVLRDSHVRDLPIFEAKYPQFRGKADLQLLPMGPWMPCDGAIANCRHSAATQARSLDEFAMMTH